MRLYAALCILLLAIYEPQRVHATKKVVLVFPRQIRRSPMPPWRPPPNYKKSSPDNDYHHYTYHSYPHTQYHGRKPFYKSPPFPHGGDDFDQGHEEVNHVHIPHGKGISHAITYGKGYIPYDSIKGSFSFGRERYTGKGSRRPSEPEYASTSYTSPVYAGRGPLHASYSEHSHPDSYFSDDGLDFRERQNERNKFYSSRSIDKETGLKPHRESVNIATAATNDRERELVQRGTDVYGALPQNPEAEGAIILPSGIPPATIAGNKEGIVLKDSVSLDEYHKKLEELTKSWPATFGSGTLSTAGFQQLQLQGGFQTPGLESGFGGSSWLTDFAQPKRGYAVKEDLMEPGHDFRTMPIQTSPIQSVPIGVNVGGSGFIPTDVHG